VKKYYSPILRISARQKEDELTHERHHILIATSAMCATSVEVKRTKGLGVS
jgi:hypothetical protein